MGKPSSSSRKSALHTLKQNLVSINAIGPTSKHSLSREQRKNVDFRARNEEIGKFSKRKNPFDSHYNRPKFEVVNKKLKKHESAGNRMKTHVERKRPSKIDLLKRNIVNDKRFGENKHMDEEELEIRRLKFEAKQKANNRFNLNDDAGDEDSILKLTHLGNDLDQLDDYDRFNPHEDSEDDDQAAPALTGDDKLDEAAHNAELEELHEHRSRPYSEIVAEIIAKSKHHRAERQKIAGENQDITEELDANFDDIMGSLTVDTHRRENERKVASNNSYDSNIKQLMFDKRAAPTLRVKSEEEIALDEKEKLEKLESERIARMQPGNKTNAKETVSGDALNQNLPREKSLYETAEPLTYKDGVLVEKEGNFITKASKDANAANLSSDEEEEDDEDTDEEEDEDDDEEADEDEEEDETDSEEEEDSGFESQSENSNADGDASEEEEEDAGAVPLDPIAPVVASEAREVKSTGLKMDKAARTMKDSTSAAEVHDAKSSDELPYTFDYPEMHEDLYALMQKYDFSNTKEILHRLQILYNPKLGAENIEKMKNLLINLTNVCISQFSIALAKTLYPEIRELCKRYSPSISEWLHSQLVSCKVQSPPSARSCALMHIICDLYPHTDFYHALSTPAMVLMANWITMDKMILSRKLFLLQILLKTGRYQSQIPATLSKLLDELKEAQITEDTQYPILDLGEDISTKRKFPRRRGRWAKDSKASGLEVAKRSSLGQEKTCAAQEAEEEEQDEDDNDKSSYLKLTLALVRSFFLTFAHLAAIQTLLDMFRERLRDRSDCAELLRDIEHIVRSRRTPLVAMALQPVQASTTVPLDPKVQEKLTLHNTANDDSKILMRQLRKEKASVIRDFRRDAQVATSKHLKAKIARDTAYETKMRRVEGALGDEVGESRKEERGVKRMREKESVAKEIKK